MRMSRNRYRMVYSVLLIVAFFIPAYNSTSALHFILLAIDTVRTDADVMLLDLVVILVPLLFIPVSAVLIFLRAAKRRPSNGLLLSLPLFLLLFFFVIMSFDIYRQSNSLNMIGLLKDLRAGFYLAALAAVLLLLSYSKRETLNFGSK